MINAIKKFGNSAGVIIPKPLLAELGVQAGDDVDMHIEDGKIIIERAERHIRKGWADDAKRLAAEDDDSLAWPELSNDDDLDLVW